MPFVKSIHFRSIYLSSSNPTSDSKSHVFSINLLSYHYFTYKHTSYSISVIISANLHSEYNGAFDFRPDFFADYGDVCTIILK